MAGGFMALLFDGVIASIMFLVLALYGETYIDLLNFFTIILAGFSSTFALILLKLAIKNCGFVLANLTTNSWPVWHSLVACLLFQQYLTGWQLSGIAVAELACVILAYHDRLNCDKSDNRIDDFNNEQ